MQLRGVLSSVTPRCFDDGVILLLCCSLGRYQGLDIYVVVVFIVRGESGLAGLIVRWLLDVVEGGGAWVLVSNGLPNRSIPCHVEVVVVSKVKIGKVAYPWHRAPYVTSSDSVPNVVAAGAMVVRVVVLRQIRAHWNEEDWAFVANFVSALNWSDVWGSVGSVGRGESVGSFSLVGRTAPMVVFIALHGHVEREWPYWLEGRYEGR